MWCGSKRKLLPNRRNPSPARVARVDNGKVLPKARASSALHPTPDFLESGVAQKVKKASLTPSGVQTIVTAWSEEREVYDGKPFAKDLGVAPKMRKIVVPHAAMWMNRGGPSDVEKAKKYAEKEGHRVFLYPTSEKDPLGRARKDVLVTTKVKAETPSRSAPSNLVPHVNKLAVGETKPGKFLISPEPEVFAPQRGTLVGPYFAVHRLTPATGSKDYSLTHVLAGVRVILTNTKAQAIAIGDRLNRELGDKLNQSPRWPHEMGPLTDAIRPFMSWAKDVAQGRDEASLKASLTRVKARSETHTKPVPVVGFQWKKIAKGLYSGHGEALPWLHCSQEERWVEVRVGEDGLVANEVIGHGLATAAKGKAIAEKHALLSREERDQAVQREAQLRAIMRPTYAGASPENEFHELVGYWERSSGDTKTKAKNMLLAAIEKYPHLKVFTPEGLIEPSKKSFAGAKLTPRDGGRFRLGARRRRSPDGARCDREEQNGRCSPSRSSETSVGLGFSNSIYNDESIGRRNLPSTPFFQASMKRWNSSSESKKSVTEKGFPSTLPGAQACARTRPKWKRSSRPSKKH